MGSVSVLLHIRIVTLICPMAVRVTFRRTLRPVGVAPIIAGITHSVGMVYVVASHLSEIATGDGLMGVRWICHLMRRIVEIVITIAV